MPSMSFELDRRALMRSAILLVGGTLVPGAVLAQSAPAFFSAGERATLDAVCDTLIPRTDTPGAIDAGVPAFVDGMMRDWANAATQASFRAVLLGIDTAGDPPFAALAPAERAPRLADYGAQAMRRGDRNYRRFKELALMGYYLSEAGATQELRYELVPGVWEPAVALTPETRAWAV